MAAISISFPLGAPDEQPASYTVGVLAPGAGDFEFRWNQTSTGNPTFPITREMAIRALRSIERQLENGTFTFTAGTPEAFP